MQPYTMVLLPLGGMLVGWLGSVVYAKFTCSSASKQAKELLEGAKRQIAEERRNLTKENQNSLRNKRQLLEREFRTRNDELNKQEKKLASRENSFKEKNVYLERREQQLTKRTEGIKKQEDEISVKHSKLQESLEMVAQMSRQQAREELTNSLLREVNKELQGRIARLEQEARRNAQQRTRDIILTTMQRLTHTLISESSVAAVLLPNDEMKGRIIGREGRNIRALETLTGADIIIDDTPDSVSVSCFDPVRKAIACMALERLIGDGRIHPARIEETVLKVSEEVENTMIEEAEKVLQDLEIVDMHPKGVRALGRLYFRTSYGQNVLYHSREVAMIAGMLAAEIGLDAKICTRAALMHDLGKGLPPIAGMGHTDAGAELAKSIGEDARVIEAIVDHHEDVDTTRPELMLVKIADAISAARPGARRESIENYIKRLSELERIAQSFSGVDRVFAFQAGRELRVMVNNQSVDDRLARKLAKQIASKIEAEMKNFPGRIRITIIREMRAVEYAH